MYFFSEPTTISSEHITHNGKLLLLILYKLKFIENEVYSSISDSMIAPIRKDEIKEALKKMANGKVEGPDQILMEVWKCLGEEGLKWLVELFNIIFRSTKMPREWRFSTIIPLFKDKRDIQDCNNYRGIKLLSHTMRL